MLCVCLSVFHPCFYWSNPVQRNNNMCLTNISCQWLINIISSQMGFPVEINLSTEKSLKLSRFKSVISVQFSYSVMSDSLRPHESQHARPPCPSPTPGVYSNSCPSSWWCHPTISPCHPLLLLPSVLFCIRVLSNESVLCIRWPKYWSFSFSISPSNEYSGLIFFRMNWFHLLAVQGTLKSLLQHHISKASLLQVSAFFMVQLSLSYMTTGKTIALTRQTFVDQIMSLLFNMLPRLVIAFLPMNKYLLISWLQLAPAVILEPKK